RLRGECMPFAVRAPPVRAPASDSASPGTRSAAPTRAPAGSFSLGSAPRGLRVRGRVNPLLGEQRAAEGVEVEIASLLTEALDDASQRRARREPQERAEPSGDADVAGREDVEAPQAAQEDQRCAPGSDARELREEAERVRALHARELLLR